MRKILEGIGVAGCGLAIWMLVGCGQPASVSGTLPVTTPPPGGTQPPGGGTPTTFTGPHVYIVSDSTAPPKVLAFPRDANGQVSSDFQFPGTDISVDGTGNLYVVGVVSGPPGLEPSSIDVYSPISSTGVMTKIRSLPTGPGTKIPMAGTVVTDSAGEIFISDGTEISVFSPTATGNADPIRSFVPQPAPGSTAFTIGVFTVDKFGNAYVKNNSDGSIGVFGPTANGNAVPARTIGGPLTGLGTWVYGMTTDTTGNLYVVTTNSNAGEGVHRFGVLEFSAASNGNVAPIRYVTAADMNPYFFSNTVAVDSDGTIYVSTGTPGGIPTVFEFSNTASGSVTSPKTVQLSGWLDSPDGSKIAVN